MVVVTMSRHVILSVSPTSSTQDQGKKLKIFNSSQRIGVLFSEYSQLSILHQVLLKCQISPGGFAITFRRIFYIFSPPKHPGIAASQLLYLYHLHEKAKPFLAVMKIL
ncbi:hypothetical protein ACH5RR_029404 [Cinchona calisaya]|uniref:Uncharacterized protein n=1 Tax=Cinchona calisaya TaxID=153742 RepID=A0ABD2YWR8_9GENT